MQRSRVTGWQDCWREQLECVNIFSKLVSEEADLNEVSNSSEVLYHSFVPPGGVVPHDLTVTAAMLYVVVVMRTSPEGRGLEAKVTEVVTNWLRETGSPLEAFPRLSLCHALLAKLTPSSLLVETDPEGKSLLLQLFPVTCHLFDRYMYIYFPDVESEV